MKLTSLLILLFLMSAFAIGVGVIDQDKFTLNEALNNVTIQVSNITLTSQSSNSYVDSFIFIVEKYIQFIATLLSEGMKIGINFGHDNPQYFTPDFIFTIVKIIVWLVVISLLIKPIGWVLAFMIVGAIALKDKIHQNRKKRRNIVKEPTVERRQD